MPESGQRLASRGLPQEACLKRLASRGQIHFSETEVQAILNIVGHIKFIKEADKLGAFLYKLCKNT